MNGLAALDAYFAEQDRRIAEQEEAFDRIGERIAALEAKPEPQPKPTPEPKPGPIPQYLTWDGESGPNDSRWNVGAKLFWRNRGVGDWMDANGAKQGTVPYTSTRITGTGAHSFDVTALVARQLAGENRGFFLQGDDTPYYFHFAGRAHSDEALRPVLRVVTDKGEFSAPARANAYWAINST